MSESNMTTCKGCLKLKARIYLSKYPSKNKKYVDETGKEWSGKTCPTCHRDKTKINMKKLRGKKEAAPVSE